ncbi:MAG: ATP-binding domain-containing protein [Sulfurovum sp.]
MENSLFYNNIKENEINKEIIAQIKEYIENNPTEQIYLITAPLGENKYSYDYEENMIVILSPKHKIIFLDLAGNEDNFEEYYEDFIEDLASISDKFNYKEYIGRPRKWKQDLIVRVVKNDDFNIKLLLNQHKIDNTLERKIELVISLLIGSINDIKKIGINKPESLLEKVKNNIILFDGEQTRFIYQKLEQKRVSIQGLSGSGKTELLLHKLKEIYTSDEESKIFFTCHNIALANTLKSRIPNFFNFMKVEKQIQWNEQLWVDNAWGSQRDKNSGLYTYICDFYNIPFSRWSNKTSYEKIFTEAVEEINKINPSEFKCAFDYILIDERQDFPDVFFELCEKITKKQIYIAGDIFQDIYDHDIEQRIINVDFVLNKCYRTDPRILMFAHSIGMGLFDKIKLNWLKDEEWKACGYQIKRNGKDISLSRESVRKFEDLDMENIKSMNINKYENINQIIDIINNIRKENPNVKPDDIAIIVLDNKNIYSFIDQLEYEIIDKLKWNVNISYQNKKKIDNTLFISNKNNVKGLEFPFIICITDEVLDNYVYRNTLYTMLTRSFIQSFLLVEKDINLEVQKEGLEIINNKKYIKTIEPTNIEKEDIKKTIIKFKEKKNKTYDEFLKPIFDSFKLNINSREKLTRKIANDIKDKFNSEEISEYIKFNKKYC